MKVAVIGGGSVYTPELVRGFIRLRDRLPLEELALVDIPEGRPRMAAVSGLLGRMLRAAGLVTRLVTTEDRSRALEGADVVVNQFRIGGLAARALDETIPLRHGVIGQETTGPGGFAMALRSIPVAVEVAREAQRLAPGAWIVNFTNPSGLVTQAIRRELPSARSVGLCNIPLILKRAVAEALGTPPDDVQLSVIGLNHLTWTRVCVGGADITPMILASDEGVRQLVANVPGIDAENPAARAAIALARRLGRIPNPYLRYYLLPQAMLDDARRAAEGDGTRAQEVQRLEEVLLGRYEDPSLTEAPEELGKRGGAHYSDAAVELLDALQNGGTAPQVVNIPNQGATPDLPTEAVIEVDADPTPEGLRPRTHGPLPPAIRGLVQAVKAYEDLTVDAALSGDRMTALQALATHPLVGDVGRASALLSDLLPAHRAYLPAFFEGPPA